MKANSILYTLSLIFLVACAEKSKTEQENAEVTHNWSESDQEEFANNCVGLLQVENVENAADYCDCLLQASMREYPDPEVAKELEQTEIVQMFEKSECMDDLLIVKIEDPWTEEAETLFINECLKAQSEQGVDEKSASEYCNCALGEVREIIPNPKHVITLTSDELNHILETCKSDN